MSFSFAFTGDDIDEPGESTPVSPSKSPPKALNTSAFPVAGQPLLPPTHHSLAQLLTTLPSKIAYNTLEVDLDGQGTIIIPRRELWDVRLQLMAEDSGQDDGALASGDVAGVANGGGGGASGSSGDLSQPGLGTHDVKTGIYEGGFKSWESSVDLVKVLAAQGVVDSLRDKAARVIELGCGTALPSVALFQWIMTTGPSSKPVTMVLADYNPTVLQLVTMPNLLLAWALQTRDRDDLLAEALATEGELEITPALLAAFQSYLSTSQIEMSFLSGAWSDQLVALIYSASVGQQPLKTVILGAETIYSPLALDSFSACLMTISREEAASKTPVGSAVAYIAAKRHYFGVGGSLDDFVDKMRGLGVVVAELRQETQGVRRGVVSCVLS